MQNVQNALLVLLSGVHLALSQRLYFTQLGDKGHTALYKFSVNSPLPAPASGALGLLPVGLSDVTRQADRGPNLTDPMGVAVVGSLDGQYNVVLGGKEWLYTATNNDSTFVAAPNTFMTGFQVRSTVIASGYRRDADSSVVYLGLWSHTLSVPSGIYRMNASRVEAFASSATPIFEESSPCPDGLTMSMDKMTLFWTDVCDGKIYSKFMGNFTAKKLVMADKDHKDENFIQPKGLAFTADFRNIVFVANYVIYTAELDGRAPNITGPSPVEKHTIQVTHSILGTGIVAPIAIAVDSCVSGATEKVYWSDACNGKIRRSNLDGSELEDVVTELTSPTQFALLCNDLTTTSTTTTLTTTTTTLTTTSTSSTNTSLTTKSSTTNSTTQTTIRMPSSTIKNRSTTTTANTTTQTTITTSTGSTTTNTTTATTSTATTVTTNSSSTTVTTTTATTTNVTTTTLTTSSTNTTTSYTVTTTNITFFTTTTNTSSTSTILTTTTSNSSTSTTSTTTSSTTNTSSVTTTVTTTVTKTSTNTSVTTNFTILRPDTTTTNTTSTTKTLTTTNATQRPTTTNTTQRLTTMTTTLPPGTTATTTNTSTTVSSTTVTSTSTTLTTTSTTSTTTKVLCACDVPLYNMGESKFIPKHSEVKLLEFLAGTFIFDSGICATTTTSTTVTATLTTVTKPVTSPPTTSAAPACATPETDTGGTYQEMGENQWVLQCKIGKTTDGSSGNFVVCEDGVYYPEVLPQCVDTTETCSTDRIKELHTSSVGEAGLVSGVLCEGSETLLAEVPISTICKAVCKSQMGINQNATGEITCLQGQMQDYSYCIQTGYVYTVQQVSNVKGGINAGTDLAPNIDDLEYGYCGALLDGSQCSFVYEVTSAPVGASRRLLLLDDMDGIAEEASNPEEARNTRRLGVIYNMNYTISIPTTSNVDPQGVLTKAQGFSDPNSTTSLAFIAAVKTRGCTLTDIVQTKAPTVSPGIVLLDSEGNIISPKASIVKAAVTKAKSSSNLALLLGAAIGGTIGMILICVVVYYCMVMRKKAEA